MPHLIASRIAHIVPQAKPRWQIASARLVCLCDLVFTFNNAIVGPSFTEEGALTKLLVGTNNAGKLREYEELLLDLPKTLEITFPAQEGLTLNVEELGETFEENARIKALAYAQASGLLSLADDSGLEVDALGGAPGVYSARYAGPTGSDVDRYRKLLDALANVPDNQRTARFRCVVALALPNGTVHTADGVCEGKIGFAPRGKHGFGYDPIFVVKGYRGHTMAELPPDVKNKISHRARALSAIQPVLRKVTGAPEI
jgi:XTP/dITP diphosphohydrolase